MTVFDLVQQFHALSVALTPYSDGILHYKAPKGVLPPELLDAMRQYKLELHALVEAFEERAAMVEYYGGLSRAAAEQVAWQCVLGHPPELPPRTAVPVPRGDNNDEAQEHDTTRQLCDQDAADVVNRRPPA